MASPTTPEAWEFALKFLKNNEAARQEIYLTSGIMEQIKDLQKYKYVDYGRQQGKSEYFRQYMQEWKPEMYHCRAVERKLDDLQRCGCNRCYEEYRRLERDYYRQRDYSRDYYIATQVASIAKVELKMTETNPVEEPKNYAHKLLVDQLKAQQSALTSKNANIDADKNTIKSYHGYLRTKKAEKLAIETKIKELSVALKKLGHKDALA